MAMERIIAGMDAELARLSPSDPTARFIVEERERFDIERRRHLIPRVETSLSLAFRVLPEQLKEGRDRGGALALHAAVLLLSSDLSIPYDQIGERYGILPAEAFKVSHRARRLFGIDPGFAETVQSVAAVIRGQDAKGIVVYRPGEFILPPGIKVDADPASVIEFLSNELGIPIESLQSPSRAKPLATDRAVIGVIVREITDAPFDKIVRLLGRINHTTAIHWAETVRQKIDKDPLFADYYNSLRTKAIQEFALVA